MIIYHVLQCKQKICENRVCIYIYGVLHVYLFLSLLWSLVMFSLMKHHCIWNNIFTAHVLSVMTLLICAFAPFDTLVVPTFHSGPSFRLLFSFPLRTTGPCVWLNGRAAICWHASKERPLVEAMLSCRDSSPPSAELRALPFCGQLALTANTGAESQLKPLPYFFLA